MNHIRKFDGIPDEKYRKIISHQVIEDNRDRHLFRTIIGTDTYLLAFFLSLSLERLSMIRLKASTI